MCIENTTIQKERHFRFVCMLLQLIFIAIGIVNHSEHFRKHTNALYISSLAADTHLVKVNNLEISSYQDQGILVIE